MTTSTVDDAGTATTVRPRPRRGVRIGPVGFPVRPRVLLCGAGLVVVLLGLLAVAVFTGELHIPADRAWAALLGHGRPRDELVVVDRRLARALAAIGVGFALGVAGTCTQAVTRNPIATPDVLGVTAGASMFGVLLITRPSLTDRLTEGGASTLLLPATVVGGLLTALLIVLLSWRDGFDGLRLILVGLGVNALALAVVDWLLTRASLEEAAVAQRWLTGSLAGAALSDQAVLVPVIVLGLVLAVPLSRDIGALRLGTDVASGLGTRTVATQLGVVAVAVLLTSAATAVAGPVAFVAFVAPQAALRLLGTAGPPILAGGLLGAALLLGADLTAQWLPGTLPVGVVTAVLGAPALLALLIRYQRRSSV